MNAKKDFGAENARKREEELKQKLQNKPPFERDQIESRNRFYDGAYSRKGNAKKVQKKTSGNRGDASSRAT